VKRLAKRAVRRAVHALGYDVVRLAAPASPHEQSRRRVIERLGVDVVLDVGANEGQYARRLREVGYDARIVSLEPQRDAFEKLRALAAGDPRWEVHKVAVGSEPGTAQLNVGAFNTTSSLVPVASSFAEHEAFVLVGTETVDVVPLDAAVDEFLEPHERLFLKVDIQGLELDVLRSAPATVARALAFEVEVPLVHIYESDLPYVEMLRELESMGGRLVSAQPEWIDPDTGHGLFLDAIFVRD
jgi:FkbM family methyltransferase